MMIAALLVALSFTQTPAPAATGRLSGRVTAEGTNAPIAGARVMVFPMMRAAMPRERAHPHAAAGDDGPGRPVCDRRRGGRRDTASTYRGPASHHQRTPSARPRMYTVAAGQALDNITVVLQKGAVISGKVLDQKGEPVTDARVMALRRITPPGASTDPPRLDPRTNAGPTADQ